MTVANFKSMIAAYMNRTVASLTSDNSQDILLQAMNDARRGAQRDYCFEICKTEDAYLATHIGGANWMTGCKTTPGGNTAVLMRRIDEVWNYGTQAVGATTYYPRTTRVDFSYSGQFKRELLTSGDDVSLNYTAASVGSRKFAYATGSSLFLANTTTSTIVKLVGIKWLDEMTAASDEDIFLVYFTDWFKYATIAALNVYLKDSERFSIDMVAMEREWASVKMMDSTMANMGEYTTLD